MSFNPQVVEKKQFELAPKGLYAARLARVIELGTQTDKYGAKPKVVFGFTVPALTIEVDGVEKQRMVWTSKFGLNQTSNPDGNLMKYVNAIKPDATHLSQLLPEPCMIEIDHTKPKDDGSQYEVIANVTKPMAGLAIPEPDCDVYMFEFEHPDKEVWDKLSESRQTDIKAADNAAEMLAKLEGNQTVPATTATVDTADFDDDIPF